MSDLAENDIFDKNYQILRLLGEGGMGSVYLAKDLILERLVAVKLLHSSRNSSADKLARFERESKVLSTLQHPNIVSLYKFGICDGLAYIVTEYLDGQTLGTLIARNDVTVFDCISIAIQVCAAMQCAHDAGTIHRDLKPENIMIVNEPSPKTAKVIDFGLARFLSAEEHQQLTGTNTILGSALYMSPEQCQQQTCDQRSDIYSLGCILYEAIAGVPHLVASSRIEMMHKQVSQEPARLISRADEKLPPGLAGVVAKALQKKPEERYQSMSEFCRDLETVRDERGSDVRLNPKAGAKGAIITVLVLLLLLLPTAVGFSVWKKDKNEHENFQADLNSIRNLNFKNLAKRKVVAARALDFIRTHRDKRVSLDDRIAVYRTLREVSTNSTQAECREALLKCDEEIKFLQEERIYARSSHLKEVLMARGRLHIATGEREKASEDFRAALKSVPFSKHALEAVCELARNLAELGKLKEAEIILRENCTADLRGSDHLVLLELLNLCHTRLKRHEDARQIISVLKANPRAPKTVALTVETEIATMEKLSDETIVALRKQVVEAAVREKNPDLSAVAMSNGDLMRVKHPAEAEQAYLKGRGAARTTEEKVGYMLRLGIVNSILGINEQLDSQRNIAAVKFFNQVLQAKPNDDSLVFDAQRYLGSHFQFKHCFKEAVSAFEEALKVAERGNFSVPQDMILAVLRSEKACLQEMKESTAGVDAKIAKLKPDKE
jgi:serine/threonine protein kinase